MTRLIEVLLLIVSICAAPSLTLARQPATRPQQQSDETATQGEDKLTLPNSSRTPLLRKVEDSISRGSRYLLARQNADGSFGDVDATPDQRVGETSLVTLALLNCGESHQSK